jgi:ferritin-like metal-binding protein YciE
MAVDSLRMHLIEELTDLLDAENQLTKALPKLARAATTTPLKTAFQKHLAETRTHVTRLNDALRELGETPRRKTCEGMQGLVSEGEKTMRQARAGALRDAVLITSAQKVEHYEMASYGTARTYAQVLGESRVAKLLAQTLKEEKAADGKLTSIAEGSVNEKAATEWREQKEDGREQEEDGIVVRSAAWMGRSLGLATRRLGVHSKAAAVSDTAHDRARRRPASRPSNGRNRRATKKR